MHVVVAVADHEQNGFVASARWPDMTEGEARSFIEQDALVDDDVNQISRRLHSRHSRPHVRAKTATRSMGSALPPDAGTAMNLAWAGL